MAGEKPARNGLLLQSLKAKLVSFDAGGFQKTLPQQLAAFPAPAGPADPNAIASVRTLHLRHKATRLPASSRRAQTGDMASTLVSCLSARPHPTRNY